MKQSVSVGNKVEGGAREKQADDQSPAALKGKVNSRPHLKAKGEITKKRSSILIQEATSRLPF